MENGFLDNFVLPDGAAEAIKRAGITSRKLGDGIDFFNFGHDNGVAYRFFVHQVKREIKSKIARVPIYDGVEMIEWMPDRFQQPTEQIRFLPSELLEFEVLEYDQNGNPSKIGECIGGKYKPAYDAWKKGLNAPGLSLHKWGVLGDSEVATLHELRIYSVEQFAAQPRDKINRLPKDPFHAAFEEAVQYVNGKIGRDATEEMAGQILKANQENSKLRTELEALQAQMKQLLTGTAELKKKRGPRKKSEGSENNTDDSEQ